MLGRSVGVGRIMLPEAVNPAPVGAARESAHPISPELPANAGEVLSMPPRCRSVMPDQVIVIWTPARLLGALFRALLAPSQLASGASVDDGA
jgi:hypothetical protein